MLHKCDFEVFHVPPWKSQNRTWGESDILRFFKRPLRRSYFRLCASWSFLRCHESLHENHRIAYVAQVWFWGHLRGFIEITKSHLRQKWYFEVFQATTKALLFSPMRLMVIFEVSWEPSWKTQDRLCCTSVILRSSTYLHENHKIALQAKVIFWGFSSDHLGAPIFAYALHGDFWGVMRVFIKITKSHMLHKCDFEVFHVSPWKSPNRTWGKSDILRFFKRPLKRSYFCLCASWWFLRCHGNLHENHKIAYVAQVWFWGHLRGFIEMTKSHLRQKW